MNVLNLVASLTLDNSNFDSELEQSEDKAESFGNALGTGLVTAAKAGAAAIAAVGTAVVALGTAIYKQTRATAEYGDKVDKMSQKIGISTDAYQEWDYVMNLAGGSVDNLQMGMKTLSNVLVEAAEGSQSAYEALEAVGLEVEDLEGMTLEEKLNVVIGALGDMEEGEERTAAASKLLGRAAMDMAPLFNMTAEEIEDAKKEAHELGMVMSQEDVKAAATLQDSFTRFEGALRGARNEIFSDFMPALTAIVDGMTMLVAGNEAGTESIIEGFNAIVSALSEKVPVVLEIAGKIAMSLINGLMEHIDDIIDATIAIITALLGQIVEMLPQIAQSAVRIIFTLVDKIIDLLPELIEAAIEVVVTLAQGIIQAIPRLIPSIVSLVMAIVEIMTNPDNIGMIINLAVQLIVALANGLIQALPVLIEKLPTIITNLCEGLLRFAPELVMAGIQLIFQLGAGLIQAAPQIIQGFINAFMNIKDKIANIGKEALTWGKDLIDNFVNGIKERINKVKDSIKSVGESIKNFLGFSEPKEGPLSNFHTFAPDMMELFAKGIKDNENLITAQIERSFDIEGNIKGATGNGLPGASTGLSGVQNDRPINITVQSVLDGRIIAESVYKYQRSQQRVYGR